MRQDTGDPGETDPEEAGDDDGGEVGALSDDFGGAGRVLVFGVEDGIGDDMVSGVRLSEYDEDG